MVAVGVSGRMLGEIQGYVVLVVVVCRCNVPT